MNDLIEFLRAQLDDDEQVARELLVKAQRTYLQLKEPRLLGREIPGWHDWPDVEAMCTLRLAEVGAKRRTVRLHGADPERGGCCFTCVGFTESPCPTLRLLALPYADREGYRSEWAP